MLRTVLVRNKNYVSGWLLLLLFRQLLVTENEGISKLHKVEILKAFRLWLNDVTFIFSPLEP